MSRDGAVVGEVNLAREDVRGQAVPADDAPLEVKQHVGGSALREREAVECDVRRGGDFRLDGGLGVCHSVETGRGFLRGLRELVVVGAHGGTGERLDEQVAKIAAPRAADGGLVETVELRILELVSARVGPFTGAGRRTGLDETERRGRVGVAVRGTLRADERVNVAGEILAGE